MKSTISRGFYSWIYRWISKHLSLNNSKKTMALITVMVLFFIIVVASFSDTVQAATNAWQGEETVRSYQKIDMKPGSAITFIIKFKNTGTKTWNNSASDFVALATVDPIKRESNFKHAFWNEVDYRPARLLEPSVAPGEVGTFRFALRAPDAVGEYNETFQAVAKGVSWIEGTKFSIPIVVAVDLPKVEEAPQNTVTIEQDYPVTDSAFSAQWQGGDVYTFDVKPGEQILKTLTVKNTGTATWNNSGNGYVSIYSVRPNYHDSAFHSGGPGWISKVQVRMATDQVIPGETGSVVLLIQAPSQSGTHKENLRLASEDHSWLVGGEMQIVLNVAGSQNTGNRVKDDEDEETAEEVILYKDLEYEAMYLVSSHRSLQLKPGEKVTFQVGFKNVGDVAWNASGNRHVSLYTIEPNYRTSRFASTAANGWVSSSQIKMSQDKAEPGQLAYFKFELKAPTTPGNYSEKFRLAAEDYSWIKGGELTLPIVVVKGKTGTTPSNPSDNSSIDGPLGPMMRVGILHSTDPFSMTADSPFEVRTGAGTLLASLPAKTEVVVDYIESTGNYTVTSASINYSGTDYIVLRALDNQTIMEILSLERLLPWNPAVNENLFRGSLEIRHSEITDKTWAINILPMELYLRGIAETSSESPVEFLKVMSVAARTYATYHYERQTKHADEYFYVDSEFDQVYKGYALEKRHPSLVQAVTETAGEVVTYTDSDTGEKKIAITPYFSQSDGRTRSWSEVWGGEVAWAQSVPVPQDTGKTLLGHGVGMSARGGLLMVVDDGKTYQEVLHYFFQGIGIDERY